MTIGLWIAIIFVLLGMLIETLVFWKRRLLLRTKEQCFEFHELRDRLQMLSHAGKLRSDSLAYRFLCLTINVAIRNAGEIKLSHLMDISRTIKRESHGDDLQEELKKYPAEVQAFASDVLNRFAWMLVANDDVTKLLFKGLGILTKVANHAVITGVKWIAAKIAPQHVQVVREANDFSRLGQRLAPSY